MMFKKLFIAVGAAMTLAYAVPSSAAPILDQSFDAVAAGSTLGGVIASIQELGQTFTSGISGQLTRIDLQIRSTTSSPPTSDLLFDILPSDGTFPTGPAIASGSISRESIPASLPIDDPFVSLDLSSFNIMVSVGESLAILLRNPNPGNYSWFEVFGGDYAGGNSLIRLPPETGFGATPLIDQGFRTFVDPDAIVVQVSEPGTIALLGLGLIGIGFARRRMAG